MIETSSDKLKTLGFRYSGGPLGGALWEKDYYLIKEDSSLCLVMKKISDGIYIPHRAYKGDEQILGEEELNDTPLFEEPKTIEQLLESLREQALQATSNKIYPL